MQSNEICICICTIVEKRHMRQAGVEEDVREWTTRISRLRHESVQHLFWECVHVKGVIDEVGCRLTGNNGCVFDKECFFEGLDDISIDNINIYV
jgi:hypothetical protein